MLGAAVVAGAFALVTSSPGGGYWRLLGVLVVLGTLFTLLALIARRLDRRPTDRDGAGDAQGWRPPARTGDPTDPSLMVGWRGAGC
jgi:hypothetical protein